MMKTTCGKRTLKQILKWTLAILCASSLWLAGLDSVSADDGYVIQKHDVIMDVSADGSIMVTETMDIHFLEQRHGIYVNIPSEYHMVWQDGEDRIYKEYTFPVHNVKVLSKQSRSISYSSEGVQIKIGSGDYYAQTYETYKFRYVISTRDLDLAGRQMLFMNIISGDWSTATQKVTFTINMPKPFDINEVWFDSPAGLTQSSTGDFYSSISGNTITGGYSSTLNSGEAITIKLALPNDYYTFPDVNSYAMSGVLIGGIFALIWATLFFFFGQDAPLQRAEQYHAPAGLSSAEVGFIIDGKADTSDLCSLLIDWGRRGIVTIHQTDEALIIRKVGELEPSAHPYEETIFNGLFRKRTEVNIDKLKNRFYKTMEKARDQLTQEHKTGQLRIVTKESVVLQVIGTVLLPVPLVAMTLMIGLGYAHQLGAIGIAVAEALGLWIGIVLLASTVNTRFTRRPTLKALAYLGSAVLAAGSFNIVVYYVGKLGASIWYSVGAMAFEIVAILAVLFMTRRTPYATTMLGQILGLRDFIIHAKGDTLAKLNQDNPYYFYDILPYAYALGLVKVWNDHFVNLTIKPCDWYQDTYGYGPYMMMTNFDNHMHEIQEVMTSVPASSSGGGSVSSGGSSGGGFSGSGFGGSGGGSW